MSNRRWLWCASALVVECAIGPGARGQDSPPPDPQPTTPPAETPQPVPDSAEAPHAPAQESAPAQPAPTSAPTRPRPGERRPAPGTPAAAQPGAAAQPETPALVPEAPPPPPPPEPLLPAEPLGFAGPSNFGARPIGGVVPRSTIAIPDRWRIGWPRWDRYGRQAPSDPIWHNNDGGDIPYTLGDPLNPYDRSVLKGDYPVIGDDIFFNMTAVSDTFVAARKLPTPSGVSAVDPGSFDFFGAGEQLVFKQTGLVSFDLFQGATAFRPVDWLFRVTPAFDVNQVWLRENVAEADVRGGDERGDSHFFLQETFFEMHVGDLSPWFDFAAAKIGRQLFVSDFRGFVFNDVSDGVRVFGTAEANRIQWNLAFFNQVDKDTNSEFNTLDWRDQQVVIANLFHQDFIWPGYTAQFSFHWNHDQSDEKYDNNGFLVRPSLIGSVTLQDTDAFYFGWAGDGHIGRLNLNHQFYYVTGQDRQNPLAGQSVDIGAYMAALELSMDVDWLRPKASFLFASGDGNATDGRAEGFDGIADNPTFAGGAGSFFVGNAIRLFGVNLKSGRSFYNDLAGAKGEGQSNYVNPGTIVGNIGLDAEITPRLRASFNANTVWFANTGSLEYFLNQNDVGGHFGEEVNLTVQWRPLLNNNIIITGGASGFFPGQGFRDVFEDDGALYQFFAGVTLVY